MQYEKGVICCIIGASIMILGTIIRSGIIMYQMWSYLIQDIGSQHIISAILIIFTIIELIGSVSIIIGALIIGTKSDNKGKRMISRGIGIWLTGLIVIVSIGLYENSLVEDYLTSFMYLFGLVVNGIFSIVGLLIAIYGRTYLKKKMLHT